MAAPNNLLAGYLAARNPPGTWVTKYPQKIDESTADIVPNDHLFILVFCKRTAPVSDLNCGKRGNEFNARLHIFSMIGASLTDNRVQSFCTGTPPETVVLKLFNGEKGTKHNAYYYGKYFFKSVRFFFAADGERLRIKIDPLSYYIVTIFLC